MLGFIARRGLCSRSVANPNMVKQIIKNPPGYEAVQVSTFSIASGKKRKRPMAFLRKNNDRAEIDVMVFVPEDQIVGVDVVYEPNTTLGRLHWDIYEPYMESFALAKGMKPTPIDELERVVIDDEDI